MLSRPLAFAALAAGCMTAAAGGAYVAMRENAATPPAEAVEAPAQPVASSGFSATAAPAPVEAEDGSIAEPLEAPVSDVVSAPRSTASVPRAGQRRRAQTPRVSGSAAREAAPPAAPVEPIPTTTPVVVPSEPLPPLAPPAPVARFEEIVIPSETVLGVQMETTVTSERARIEDRVEGHVTRDISVGGRVAIPAGTRVLGSVTLVERGGKFKERARIGVRFHTAQLADGTRVPLQTTAIMREGDSPSRESAAKVGGSAVGGAILGAILGGARGAVIGGTAGAAGGSAVVAAGDRNAATLPAGSTVSVRLMSDVRMTVER